MGESRRIQPHTKTDYHTAASINDTETDNLNTDAQPFTEAGSTADQHRFSGDLGSQGNRQYPATAQIVLTRAYDPQI